MNFVVSLESDATGGIAEVDADDAGRQRDALLRMEPAHSRVQDGGTQRRLEGVGRLAVRLHGHAQGVAAS